MIPELLQLYTKYIYYIYIYEESNLLYNIQYNEIK